MKVYKLEEVITWVEQSMVEVDDKEMIAYRKQQLKEIKASNAKEFHRDEREDEWIPIHSTLTKKEVFTKINKVLQVARNNRAPKYNVEVVGYGGDLRAAIIEDLKSLKDEYEENCDQDWYINTINNLSIKTQYTATIESLESDGYEVECY